VSASTRASYDPLIAKVIVHGGDREHARRRMLRALEEYVIEGPKTLIGFHRALLSQQCFVDGETCFGLVESELLARQAEELEPARASMGIDGRNVDSRISLVELDGRRYEVRMLVPEPQYKELVRRRQERQRGHHGGHARDAVTSPMQGTVLAVEVAEGDEVEAGQVICIVEAMKMENEITAHREGVVSELSVAAGQAVNAGQVICVVTQDGDEP
jgi:acetyl-CoA/propionyl-CoA/long-chain acyl-CoA carboxylase, biotin carboxylase, biotin carboxyl carrier protein